MDAVSGEIINSHYLEGNGIVSLALSEGALFVGEGNGRITCFDEAPAQPGSPPPTTAPEPSTPFVPLSAAVISAVLTGIIVYYLMKRRKL